MKLRFAALFVCLLLCGCGSGGSGTSNPPTRTYVIDNWLKKYTASDSWEYSLVARSSSGATYTGSARSFITNVPGSDDLFFNTAFSLQGQTLTTQNRFRQNSHTRGCETIAIDGTTLDRPALWLPGGWGPGVALDDTATTNGNSVRFSAAILGKETVTTPAGRFETWKTAMDQRSESLSTTGTYWYAPQTGHYVKAEYSVTFFSGPFAGQSYSYDVNLTATSAPLEGTGDKSGVKTFEEAPFPASPGSPFEGSFSGVLSGDGLAYPLTLSVLRNGEVHGQVTFRGNPPAQVLGVVLDNGDMWLSFPLGPGRPFEMFGTVRIDGTGQLVASGVKSFPITPLFLPPMDITLKRK